jgi:hypothetical protein
MNTIPPLPGAPGDNPTAEADDVLGGVRAGHGDEGGAGRRPSGDDDRLTREIAERDERLSALERSFKAAVLDRELATALAGKPLVAGAAVQLIKLWRDEFDVYEDGGEFRVSARDGRKVSQVVNERLAAPEYAHFCLPSSRGGAGGRDANRVADDGTARARPRTLGEAIVMRWREESATRPDNFLKPIGLRRHR